MKRAYRGGDAMRIEGRPIVVDVERGHTVPLWLPRRLGGGLGGTRYVYQYEYRYAIHESIAFLISFGLCIIFF